MVYGHRRVGKSELLRQAIRGSGLPYVFFKCHQTSESQNLTTFLADLYDPENFD